MLPYVDYATEKFTPMLLLEIKRVIFLEEIKNMLKSANSNVSSPKKEKEEKEEKKKLVGYYRITLKASALKNL